MRKSLLLILLLLLLLLLLSVTTLPRLEAALLPAPEVLEAVVEAGGTDCFDVVADWREEVKTLESESI